MLWSERKRATNLNQNGRLESSLWFQKENRCATGTLKGVRYFDRLEAAKAARVIMSKSEVIRTAAEYGYRATYSSRQAAWFLTRLQPSKNSRAFDGIVLANLITLLGIRVSANESERSSK